jgi:DNA-binding transcriptional LysR family regulator
MPVAIGLQPQYSVAGAERRPSLFDRQNKLPTLTRHGQKLLPYARRFQELNIELSSLLGETDDSENGEVAFGCGPAPAARLIPAAIGSFIAVYRRRGCAFRSITGLPCITR